MSGLIGTLKPFESTADDFVAWEEMFQSFIVANEIDPTEKKRCVAIFISSIGLPTYTLLQTLLSPDAPTLKTLQELIDVLTAHFKPPPKAIAERYKFACSKTAGRRVRISVPSLHRRVSLLIWIIIYATN
jgi:hypothetical protein